MSESHCLSERARSRRARALEQLTVRRELFSETKPGGVRHKVCPAAGTGTGTASNVSPFTGRANSKGPESRDNDVRAVFREVTPDEPRGIILTVPGLRDLAGREALPACAARSASDRTAAEPAEPLAFTPPPRNLAASLLLQVQ